MVTTTTKNLRGSTMPENEEAAPTAEAQQEAAKASDKLSCRTRLMGPLLMLGALVAVAQAKPAVAQPRTMPPDRSGNCPRGYYNRDGRMCVRR